MADKEIKPKGRWAKKKASKKKNLSKPSYRKDRSLAFTRHAESRAWNRSDQR